MNTPIIDLNASGENGAPGTNVDPNNPAAYIPLQPSAGMDLLNSTNLQSMSNALQSGLTWFQQLQLYIQNNPGAAMAVGLGILVLAFNAQDGKSKKRG